MESMKTSSGLKLSLRWKNKRADKEEQMDTKTLVDLLQKDAEIMRPEEVEQLSRHFRSKIAEARKEADETANMQSFHAIMREVLDYRKWFEFQLECQKTGEKKRELTDRVFSRSAAVKKQWRCMCRCFQPLSQNMQVQEGMPQG